MRIILFLLILFSGYDSLCQHYNIRNISNKDGLPSSSIYQSFEDSRGYIWILTDKGISCFDGKAYKNFGSKDGFTDIRAFHMAESSDGTLWFISVSFKLYYYRNGEFRQYPISDKIGWIDIDKENKIWLLSRLGGIYELGLNHGLRKVIHGQIPLSISGASYSLLHIGEGCFLVGCATSVYLSYEKGKPIPLLSSATYENHVTPRFFRLANGRILISNHTGVFEFDQQNRKTVKQFSLNENQVFSCCMSPKDGDILFGTSRGTYLFKNGNLFNTAKKSFANHSVTHVMFSKDQNYWISTFGKGVFWYNSLAIHYDEKSGVVDNITFLKRENESIYLFALNGRIQKLKGNKIIQPFPYTTHSPNIYYALSVSDTIIYYYTSHVYSIKKGKQQRMHQDTCFSYTLPVKSEDGVYYMAEGGRIYLNSSNHLLLNRNESRQIWKYYLSVLDSNSLHRPLRVKDGIIYYQAKEGLAGICFKVRPTGDHQNRKLTSRFYKIKGEVTEVNFTNRGNVIVSTLDNGLAVFKDKGVTYINTENGLLSPYCKKVYLKGDCIWVCTNKGLSRVKLTKTDDIESITNFTSADFLLSDEVNDLLFKDSNVIVATSGGLSVFSMNAQFIKAYPPVFIEHILINNKAASAQQHFELSYTENNITVEFNSPGTRSGNKTAYRYLLIGSRHDTIIVNNPVIQLGSLQPGNYLLKAWAKNIDGLWSIKPAELSFNIGFPFWKSTWFFLFVSAFLLLLSGYLIHIKLKENDYKYKLVRSELKALQLYMNPHFIFNSLNSIHSFILQKNWTNASFFIISFSRLIRMIMSHSSSQSISIKEERELLTLYLELERSRFSSSFSYSIDLGGIQDTDYYIPSLVIQPFVENAIKYGVAGKEDGHIAISFCIKGSYIECIVEDNGVGRALIKRQQELSGREHESTGIRYTGDRLKLLFGGRITSPIIIVDQHDEQGKPNGTRVEIKLPVL